MDWLKEWTAPIPWLRDEDALTWLRSRPDSIKNLMLQFPPSCVVRSTKTLVCPAPDEHGIVSSYFEPDSNFPNGSLSVRESPDGDCKYQCNPDDLEVVGYWRGLTPDVISALMVENCQG